MMRAKLLVTLMATAAVVAMAPAARAHGHAEHGGVFSEVEEYTFELTGARQGKDDVAFSLYIKDPALKSVTTGDVTLKVRLSEVESVPVDMKAGTDQAFHGQAGLSRRGRYRTTILFTRPGQKVLKSNVSIKLP